MRAVTLAFPKLICFHFFPVSGGRLIAGCQSAFELVLYILYPVVSRDASVTSYVTKRRDIDAWLAATVDGARMKVNDHSVLPQFVLVARLLCC